VKTNTSGRNIARRLPLAAGDHFTILYCGCSALWYHYRSHGYRQRGGTKADSCPDRPGAGKEAATFTI